MMPVPVLVLVVGACGGPGGPGAAPGAQTLDDRSGPTQGEGASLPEVERPGAEAVWSAADLEAAFGLALRDGIPDPWTLQSEYLGVLSNGDRGCPGHETYIDDTHLYGCTAGSGWFYSGVSEYHQRSDTESGVYWEGIEVLGDLLFRSPAGGEFEVGGHALWRFWRDESFSVTRITTEHSGSWRWEEHDSWLAHTVSGLYQLDLQRDAGGDAVVTVDGALRVFDTDFAFEDFVLSEACGWEPSGVVSLRDPSGVWSRMDFGDACAPCAEARFGEASLGEACLDTSGIVDGLGPLLEEL